jgi:hypothetical protein
MKQAPEQEALEGSKIGLRAKKSKKVLFAFFALSPILLPSSQFLHKTA